MESAVAGSAARHTGVLRAGGPGASSAPHHSAAADGQGTTARAAAATAQLDLRRLSPTL